MKEDFKSNIPIDAIADQIPPEILILLFVDIDKLVKIIKSPEDNPLSNKQTQINAGSKS